MPQRDTMHHLVKQALINSGWEITDDPYVISYGKHNLFVDLAAIPMPTRGLLEGGIIGAQKKDRRIAVEIKEFRSKSKMAGFRAGGWPICALPPFAQQDRSGARIIFGD